MWMRTTMNYQYRYGTTTTRAMRKLYAEGGVRRFYRGIAPALFQVKRKIDTYFVYLLANLDWTERRFEKFHQASGPLVL